MPSGRKRLDPQGALQAIARMMGRIEKRVDLCDSYSLLRLSHLHDFVTGAYFAFLQDAEVESRPSTGRQQRRHPGLVHPNADAIARYARCSDLEQCTADLITVADTNGIVSQSLDREVLAELSVDKVGPLQVLLPVAIRFDLVDEDGLRLTPVADQSDLPVAFQIQPADPTAASHRILPDRGVYSATLPRDITRKSDIHRQQSRHVPLHFDRDRKGFLAARSRRGLLGSGSSRRNRPIAPVESGPGCQDSPMLSTTMGLMLEPARHPLASRTRSPAARFRNKMVTLGPALTLPCAGR